MGTLKAADKRAARLAFFRLHGTLEDGDLLAYCQSCGRPLGFLACDFSHKVPAGRGGDLGRRVQASNGIASCRACHQWLETGPHAVEARAELIASPVSLLTGGRVEWSPTLQQSLVQYLQRRTC